MDVTAARPTSLLEIISHAGWVAYPLIICSVAAVAVILERFVWGMRPSRVFPRDTALRISHLFEAGRVDDLTQLCIADPSPLGRIVLAGLRNRERSHEQIVDALELAGRRECAGLLRYVGVLGTIAAIAPLLGLLGTVVGIIKTFAVIEHRGIGSPQLLAGGISEALIATAAGICIAVPAVIFYRYFLNRAKRLTLELEEFTLGVLGALTSATSKRSTA